MLAWLVAVSVVSQSAPPMVPVEAPPLEVLPFPTSSESPEPVLPKPVLDAPAVATKVEPPVVSTGPRVERPTLEFGVGLRGFTRTFGTTDGSGAIPQWNGSAPGVSDLEPGGRPRGGS
jgi:hypothetical protein